MSKIANGAEGASLPAVIVFLIGLVIRLLAKLAALVVERGEDPPLEGDKLKNRS